MKLVNFIYLFIYSFFSAKKYPFFVRQYEEDFKLYNYLDECINGQRTIQLK